MVAAAAVVVVDDGCLTLHCLELGEEASVKVAEAGLPVEDQAEVGPVLKLCGIFLCIYQQLRLLQSYRLC